MLFIFLLCIFFIICFIINIILIQFNTKLILSNITISIIFSLIVTKIIHHNFCHTQNHINIETKELLVGLSPDYPPYAFIENDTIVGFDIDLLKIIAENLNLKLKLVPLPFHSILVSLQLNSIDIAASGLSGSPERAKEMLISNPYFQNDYLCAVSLKENSLNTIEKLKNKKIIINTGYTSENYINKHNLTNDIVRLKSVPDGLLGLSLQQGEVFITSYASLIQLLKTEEANKFFIFSLPDNDSNQEAVSFLINKKNTFLLNQINEQIKHLIENGTIKNLINKWTLV